jgi:hypothetical protein
MSDNITIKDSSNNPVVVRTTELNGVHTPRHIIDSPVQVATVVNRSSTIAAAGVAQVAAPANAVRKLLIIQNPSLSGETLCYAFATDATLDGFSIELGPGEGYIYDVSVPTQSVSIIAATIGHSYILKEG